MKVSHCCVLVATVFLLLCEMIISRLCESLITMVDGFHTLFLLMHMAHSFPPSTSQIPAPTSSSFSSSASNTFFSLAPLPHHLQSESAVKPVPDTQNITKGAETSNQSNHKASSAEFCSPTIFPKSPNCGVSFTDNRIQSVGIFLSSLLLVFLCISYFIEILNFILEPHPVQRPMLLLVVAGVSVLHKMLLFGLNCDQLWGERTRTGEQGETGYHFEVNHKADFAGEDSISQEESKDIVQSEPHTPRQNHYYSKGLFFNNPETSSSKTFQESGMSCEKEKNTAVCRSSPFTEGGPSSSQRSICPLSFILVICGLFTSFLALISSLVTLLIVPQFLHISETHSALVYLDPGLSLLAEVTLIVTAVPQVYRYGLLLLQASPPHICVSDLGRRIASVPGVQTVHDLHVWQLTESLLVASVHVHCYAGFPMHRCADVMSGVTKVLRNVGVRCCTVQPEFASSSGSTSATEEDALPIIHRQDPFSPPLLLPCSLACGKACAESMCCSLIEDTQSVLTSPGGEMKEDPQTLVIENTFL